MANQKTSLKLSKFDILVEFKSVKYARLKIKKTGEISISAPKFYTLDDCARFVKNNQIWIEKTLKKFAKKALEKDDIRLLGKIYKIKILDINEFENLKFDTKFDSIVLDPKFFKFDGANFYFTNEKNIEAFKKVLANSLFNELIDKYLPFIGRPINRITIRQMTTRHGSCNHNKGYINLALNLIEKDIKFIEYVVLHELTHLIFPHHRAEFYDFIAKIMPDFKERIKLEKI